MDETITGSDSVRNLLQAYKKDVLQELVNILNYWIAFCVDEEHDGFYGKVDNNNIPDTAAGKGAVLNARILWTFSSAFLNKKDKIYAAIAGRAFNYIAAHFYDKEFGGVYWLVDALGNPSNTRKQVYAIAFCLYGMSEYYAATQNKTALDIAVSLFNTIEEHSYDKEYGGYFEAFARNWGPLEDLRLSAKDANEKKTMNTHLHIIEAYANLYKIWPVAALRQKIISLLAIFDKYIINKNSGHLSLLKKYYHETMPDYIKWGIHVMVSQNGEGELTIGDSHEYGLVHDPFDKQFINQLVLDYLKQFASFKSWNIAQTWNGTYPKKTDGKTDFVHSPEQGVTIVNGLGGAGMTLSFGLAEEVLEGKI